MDSVGGGRAADFELVVRPLGFRDPGGDVADKAFFLGRIDRSTKGDTTFGRDDLHVLRTMGLSPTLRGR